MSEEKAKFRFKNFIINKSFIEFKNKESISDKLQVDFSLSGENNTSEQEYKLYLDVKISDSKNNLNIEIKSIGFFEYKGVTLNTEEENIYFYTSAPAILFPYIRAHIGTISNLSGINPILLPTLNLTKKGKELKENTNHI